MTHQDRQQSNCRVSMICGLLMSMVAGCGSGNQPCTVEGSVTYKSKPIEKGAIRFVTEDGTPGEGDLGPITNGRYSLTKKQMMAGKYLVMISAFQDTGRRFIPEPGAPEVVEERQYLPKKFNSSSKLKVSLKGGANTEDFNLTD
ncbi:hypothetical protein [Schlesneria paludicola]|uniref:hypothetical protein n=1 Tax=Schlesneria paludicola TaxID=360056 RepID=UPI0012FB9395|nr:hypothetical protein [Schlesneria paludicola]